MFLMLVAREEWLSSIHLHLADELVMHWSRMHKRLKEHFLIGWNGTKRANFQGSRLFQVTYNIKTEKQTSQLILCQLDVGGWRKEKDMRLTDVIKKRAWYKLCDTINRWHEKIYKNINWRGQRSGRKHNYKCCGKIAVMHWPIILCLSDRCRMGEGWNLFPHQCRWGNFPTWDPMVRR